MIDLQNFRKLFYICAFGLMQTGLISAHTINPPCENHHDSEFFEFMCDLCGCASSSGSFGFGTLSNANFIGVRYIYQKFESREGIFENSPINEEIFNTYQLWAQIPVNEKFYLSLNLPYQDLSRKRPNNLNENLNGLGDSNIIGWYKWQFYKKQKDSVAFDFNREASGHSLQFGLGVKVPTGKFEEALADNVNPGFQLGTGSFDGIFSLGYNYGSNKVGINTLLTYYLKGENKNEYQFGDQFSYSANVYTLISKEKYNIMPFVGVSGDFYDKIKQFGETLNDTDGNIMNGTLGSELALERFIFGVNYTVPLSQNLYADNVKSKNRFSIYVNFAL